MMEPPPPPLPQPPRIKNLLALRQLIENSEINEPLVFKGIHRDWEPCLWSLDMWGKLLTRGDSETVGLRCRLGQQIYDEKEPQWESKTGEVYLSWDNLVDWSDEKRWVYYDYKNIMDVIDQKYFRKFEWGRLGFPERDGKLSNLWIGTTGSFTPCHFDTYGCNLVTQVYGRKSWLMFPPSNTTYLHPSRIPYEESSVYSLINFCSPSPYHFKDLVKCSPLKVTLDPGDVLFVPSHWWHFVRSDQFSISANTWIEQAHDEFSRLQEAAVRFVIGAVVSLATPDSTIDILNPNEEEIADDSEENLLFLLRKSYEDHMKCKERRLKIKSMVVDDKSQIPLTDENAEPSQKMNKTNIDEFLANHSFVHKLTPYTFTLANLSSLSTTSAHKPCVRKQKHLNHLINAIGHPNILKQICEQFVQNVSSDD